MTKTQGLETPAIGDRLAWVRKNVLHLTQATASKRLKTTQSTLSNYEAGNRTPGGDFLARLQREFGININWLLSGQGSWGAEATPFAAAGGVPEMPTIHPDDRRLIDRIRKRLQGSYRPERFSAAVVFSPEHLSQSWLPGEGDARFVAFPFTTNMTAIGDHALPEHEIDGLFVAPRAEGMWPESLRCLQIRDDRFDPLFPRGSIVAVDVRATDPDSTDGRVALVAWTSRAQKKRSFARVRKGQPYPLFEPVVPKAEVPDFAHISRGHWQIVGRVVWAWHQVV